MIESVEFVEGYKRGKNSFPRFMKQIGVKQKIIALFINQNTSIVVSSNAHKVGLIGVGFCVENFSYINNGKLVVKQNEEPGYPCFKYIKIDSTDRIRVVLFFSEKTGIVLRSDSSSLFVGDISCHFEESYYNMFNGEIDLNIQE